MKIIVIEGTDCSGKETQSKLLKKRLIEEGYKVVSSSFPRYDMPTGKIVGGPYLGKDEIMPSFFKEGASKVDPYIASLYFAADRKYNIQSLLDESKDADILLLDRYVSSNQAHQGSKILDKDKRFYMYEWLDRLEYWLLDLPKADKTILLHMPSNLSYNLKKNRLYLDDHEKDSDYLKRSETAYIELANAYNWEKIECSDEFGDIRSIEDISEDVYKCVIKLLKEE